MLWTVKGHSWLWQTVDVLDHDEPASCNNSLQQNKISYKSQRKALRGRHPIPPSFQQSSARHTGMKEAGLRGQESKGDWDIQRRDGVCVCVCVGWGGWKRSKWMHEIAYAGSREREKGGESTGDFLFSSLLSPFPPLAMWWLFTEASPLPVEWEENGLLTGFPYITYWHWCL